MSVFDVKNAALLSLALSMTAGAATALAQESTGAHPRLLPACDVRVGYSGQP